MKEKKQDRRKYPRVNAPIYFTYSSVLSRLVTPEDVSAGGVRMYSDEKIEVGRHLDLTITLPRGRIIECRGEVVWIKELPADSEASYDIGIAFYDISRKDRTALASYFTNL